MKIIDVTTTSLFYPGAGSWQDGTTLPTGSSTGGRGGLFVHVKAEDGTEGLGPVWPYPGVRQVIETDLKGLLLDKEAFDVERLWDNMFWKIRGYGRKGVAFCAISGIDIALWDLKAKVLGLPLYRLLGTYSESVPVYGSGGWTNHTSAGLVDEMTGFVDDGFKAVKMKVGKDFGHSEREDIERVASVRKAIGDDVALYIDANNAYYSKQAIYMAKEFEQYQVGWFEEPVLADDIHGLADVRRSISIPVATGEHEYTKYGFKDLISGDGADIVQPDVGRVGGVTEWIKVAHLAHAFNLPVANHAFRLVSLHLACATPNLKIVEDLNIESEVDEIWFKEIPIQKNGMLSPFSDKPGLGLELDPYAVEKWTV